MDNNAVSFLLYSIAGLLLIRLGLWVALKALWRVVRWVFRLDYIKELEADLVIAEKIAKAYEKLEKDFDVYKRKTEKTSLYIEAEISKRLSEAYRDFLFYGCISEEHIPLFDLEEFGLEKVRLHAYPQSLKFPKGAPRSKNEPLLFTYVDPKVKGEVGDGVYRPPALTVHNGRGGGVKLPIESVQPPASGHPQPNTFNNPQQLSKAERKRRAKEALAQRQNKRMAG